MFSLPGRGWRIIWQDLSRHPVHPRSLCRDCFAIEIMTDMIGIDFPRPNWCGEVFSLYLHTRSAPAALIKALWSCQCWLDRSELMFLACTFRIEISVCQSTKFASRNFGECNAVSHSESINADDHCSWKLSLAGPNGRSSRHIAFPESKALEGASPSCLSLRQKAHQHSPIFLYTCSFLQKINFAIF